MLYCHAPGQQLGSLGEGEGGPSDAPAVFYDAYGRRLIPIAHDVGDRPETWFYVEGFDPSTAQPMQQYFNPNSVMGEPMAPPPLVQSVAATLPVNPANQGGGAANVITVYTPAQQSLITAAPTVQTQPIGAPIFTPTPTPNLPAPAPAPGPAPVSAPAPAPGPAPVSAPAPAPVSTVTSPTPAPVAAIVVPGGSYVPPTAHIAVPTQPVADVAPDASGPGAVTGGDAGASKSGGALALLALLGLAALGGGS